MLKVLRSLLLLIGLAALLPACALSEGGVATVAPVPANAPATTANAAAIAATPFSQRFVVYFDNDSAEIRASAMQILHGAAESAHGVTITDIRIHGFADSAGRKAHNQALSDRRAAAVADQLGKLGLKAVAVESKGFGEIRGKGRKHQREARRVEITIEGFQSTAQAATSAISASVLASQPQALTSAQSVSAPQPDTAATAPLRSAGKQAIKLTRFLGSSDTNQPPPSTSLADGWPSGLRHRS